MLKIILRHVWNFLISKEKFYVIVVIPKKEKQLFFKIRKADIDYLGMWVIILCIYNNGYIFCVKLDFKLDYIIIFNNSLKLDNNKGISFEEVLFEIAWIALLLLYTFTQRYYKTCVDFYSKYGDPCFKNIASSFSLFLITCWKNWLVFFSVLIPFGGREDSCLPCTSNTFVLNNSKILKFKSLFRSFGLFIAIYDF